MPGLAQTADRLDPEWFFDPLALDRSAIPKLLPLLDGASRIARLDEKSRIRRVRLALIEDCSEYKVRPFDVERIAADYFFTC